MPQYLELMGLTALALVGAAAALVHGDLLFGAILGGAAAFGGAHLIRRSADL